MGFGSVNHYVDKNSIGDHRRLVGSDSEVRVTTLADRQHSADPSGTTGGGVVERLVQMHLRHIFVVIVAPGGETQINRNLIPVSQSRTFIQEGTNVII